MTTEEMNVALESRFKKLNTDFAAVQAELKTAQDNGVSKDEVLKLHATIKTQGEALTDFIDAQEQKVVKNTMGQFRDFLVDKKTELEDIGTSKRGVIEFVPKAVGDMSTASGGDVETPPANFNTELGHFNYRNDDALLNLATVTSTGSPNFSYTELTPKEGGYDFVAEAGTKPQIDFKWEVRYETPKKIAAYEVLSEEVVTDIVRMESVARELLQKRHGLYKADAVYFAPGTGITPTGATVYARAFVAGAMALAVQTPTIMDAINACITDIYTTHNFVDETPYMANVALINPVDFFLQLVAAKDGYGLPLYPQASLFNTVNIGGVSIRPWSKIPAGKIFVADMSKYHVVNYVPFSIRIGWINAQFITNQFTMVGESRFFAFVKNLDQQAFIYDDIATIIAAITEVPPV
jgi:hypothetical protein